MNRKQIAEFVSRLERWFPEFRSNGNLLILPPIDSVLRAVNFDQFSDRTSLNATVFIQPLFVPFDNVALNFGWRLGGGVRRWRTDVEADIAELAAIIEAQALPYLRSVRAVEDVLSAASKIGLTNDYFVRTCVAYSLAWLERVPDAVDALKAIVSTLDEGIEWQRLAAERATALATALQKDPPAARLMLLQWRSNTYSALRLPEFSAEN